MQKSKYIIRSNGKNLIRGQKKIQGQSVFFALRKKRESKAMLCM